MMKLQAMAKRRKLPFYEISAVTGLGIEKLKCAIGERVSESRKNADAEVHLETAF